VVTSLTAYNAEDETETEAEAKAEASVQSHMTDNKETIPHRVPRDATKASAMHTHARRQRERIKRVICSAYTDIHCATTLILRGSCVWPNFISLLHC